MSDYQYVKMLEQYAKDVLSGKILANKWVKLSCKRHLDDLEKAKDKDYPFYFDPVRAEKICRFAELMPHIKGKWAGTLIKLEPWQCFIFGVAFGWVRRRDDLRRFREIYAEIPRKNSKSTIAAVMGNFMLSADGEAGAEVYAGATSEKQAWEVFRPAKLMAEKAPGFKKHYGVQVNASNINILKNASRFEPIIGKPGDGASPSCAIVDEFHEHESPELYDTMVTGMGARAQPMMVVITTAGSNIAGPCYDKRDQVCKVLEGTFDNDELFGIIFGMDEDDDWTDFENWKKANPNFGVSVFEDFLLARLEEAKQRTSRQNIIKCKHLNVWVNARAAWMDMEAWNRCADPNLSLEDFVGEGCFEGVDLASRIDIADRVKVFKKIIDGKTHYFVFARHYLPEDTIYQPNNTHYQGWLNAGQIRMTDGNETDFGVIEEEIIEDSKRFRLIELAFDPWQAASTAQRLAAQGASVIEFRNIVQNMSPAMKEVDAAVRGGRLHHNGDPVLAWMMSNVVSREDNKENIFPVKERSEAKIDGAVALIMAIGRAMMQEGPSESMYEDEGLFFL